MNKSTLTVDGNTYDAIVVGTGISGGWAAKELCENGLKTLVLERGRLIEHIKDYHTANLDPWDLPNGGAASAETKARKPKQHRTGYTTHEARQHFFVDDLKHPYNEDRRFDWIRGYHVGGRSLMWGRQSYRLSDIDFKANKKEGVAVDWPVRYKEIEPWYDKVEEYIGVSGQNLGLKQLPDQKLLKPMELNCVEQDLQGKIADNFDDGRVLTIGRTAHVTEGTKPGAGRSTCQYRNRCMRGCPFGAYFSSNSSTLPAAEATGNMTLRPNSIVHEVIYDDTTKQATGVRVIDTETKESMVYHAKIIFLCASTIASSAILMQSKSERFPNGLGNDSGELGHNIMDHHFQIGAQAKAEGYDDKYTKGRRPNGIYIPRFRNLGGKTNMKTFTRGYGYQGGAGRSDTSELVAEMRYGAELKEAILKPGEWNVGLLAFGETLPDHSNRFYLDYDKKDEWGLPTLTFDADFGANEMAMREDMKEQAVKMLTAAGYKEVQGYDNTEKRAMGLGIHEMGTARMGRDPKTSVLNKWNQVHTCKNVYVTDGSFMTSSGCQNPSLTYMAFTARAANHAAAEFKKITHNFIDMNRREALKNIGFAAGFAIATPTIFSLLQSCTADAKTWVPTFITEEQKTILTSITDIILPKTEGLPSASDLNVPQFLDKYMAEVLDAEEQAMAKDAFSRIVGLLKPNAETNLADLTDEDYKTLLDKHMRIKGEIDEDRKANPTAKMMTNSEFLNQMKWMTINAYKNTEQIGEDVLVYDPIPTAYYCGDLQELTGGKSYSL